MRVIPNVGGGNERLYFKAYWRPLERHHLTRYFSGLSPTVKGMLLMVLSTLAFTGMQAAIRVVAKDSINPLPAVEVAFFRNLFGLFALLPLFIRVGRGALRTSRLGMHMMRASIQTVGMLCFFTALTLIPIAEITALSFSAPLFATVLAIVILRERVRARRVSALVIGFLGVIVVVRPGLEVLSLGAVLVLVSSFGWAIAMTVIKSLSRTESALTLTLYAGLLMTPLTLIPAVWVWETPTATQLLWLIGLGTVGTVGHLAFAQALKIAEMSAVLPLDFLRLIWACAIGVWWFGEIPTSWTLSGGTMIFAAASYIAYREAQLSHARRNDSAKPATPLPVNGSEPRGESKSPCALEVIVTPATIRP